MLKRGLALVALILPLGCAAAAATAALAAGGASAAIADCNSHSKLTQTYSSTALRDALTTMPADVKEYTDCYDVIQRQLLVQLGGRHTAGASASSTPASSGSGSSLFSAPVIVVLVVLVLTAGGFGLAALRRRST